jgi:hypothetical protein
MRNIYLTCLVLCISVLNSNGQNLVANGGFENVNFSSCEIADNFTQILVSWDSPNGMAGDVFFTNIAQDCYTFQPSSTYSGPTGLKGTEMPSEGFVFAGIWVYTIEGLEQREYARGQLSSPLQIGATYRFKMKLSLGDFMESSVGELGVAFMETDQVQTNNHLILAEPQIIIDTQLNISEGWAEIDATFESDGAHEFFIIGNFKPDSETETIANASSSGEPGTYGAYYFIDEVSLELEVLISADAVGTFSLEIFPTLVQDQITIRVGEQGISRLSLINHVGQTCMERTVSDPETHIDCSALGAGMYYVLAQDRFGDVLARAKFLKVY